MTAPAMPTWRVAKQTETREVRLTLELAGCPDITSADLYHLTYPIEPTSAQLDFTYRGGAWFVRAEVYGNPRTDRPGGLPRAMLVFHTWPRTDNCRGWPSWLSAVAMTLHPDAQ